jgi:hypothetical protein
MSKWSVLFAGLLAAVAFATVAFADTAATGCSGPCLPGDADGDRVKDWADNCPLNGNTRQEDNDKDTEAPVVDQGTPPKPAGDLTGPITIYPSTPVQVRGQAAPTDRSETLGGDACDQDDDNDGIWDRKKAGHPGPDNCRKIANPDQKDSDSDTLGDACDKDFDAAAPGTGTGAIKPTGDPGPLKVAVAKVQRLRYREIGLGLPVRVTCSNVCRLVGEVVLDRSSVKGARLSGAKTLVIGRGTSTLQGKGTTYLIVKIPAKSLKNFQRKVKSMRPVLKVTTLGTGGKTVAKRRISIRR